VRFLSGSTGDAYQSIANTIVQLCASRASVLMNRVDRSQLQTDQDDGGVVVVGRVPRFRRAAKEG
jgi:hypothetical protein